MTRRRQWTWLQFRTWRISLTLARMTVSQSMHACVCAKRMPAQNNSNSADCHAVSFGLSADSRLSWWCHHCRRGACGPPCTLPGFACIARRLCSACVAPVAGGSQALYRRRHGNAVAATAAAPMPASEGLRVVAVCAVAPQSACMRLTALCTTDDECVFWQVQLVCCRS